MEPSLCRNSVPKKWDPSKTEDPVANERDLVSATGSRRASRGTAGSQADVHVQPQVVRSAAVQAAVVVHLDPHVLPQGGADVWADVHRGVHLLRVGADPDQLEAVVVGGVESVVAHRTACEVRIDVALHEEVERADVDPGPDRHQRQEVARSVPVHHGAGLGSDGEPGSDVELGPGVEEAQGRVVLGARGPGEVTGAADLPRLVHDVRPLDDGVDLGVEGVVCEGGRGEDQKGQDGEHRELQSGHRLQGWGTSATGWRRPKLALLPAFVQIMFWWSRMRRVSVLAACRFLLGLFD